MTAGTARTECGGADQGVLSERIRVGRRDQPENAEQIHALVSLQIVCPWHMATPLRHLSTHAMSEKKTSMNMPNNSHPTIGKLSHWMWILLLVQCTPPGTAHNSAVVQQDANEIQPRPRALMNSWTSHAQSPAKPFSFVVVAVLLSRARSATPPDLESHPRIE